MPIRKVGSDTPSSDTVMSTWLMNVPRRSAAYTPMGMPTTSASTAATSASSSVAGKRSAIRRDTLAPWRRLRPNSPCTALTRKCQNCTKKGWSSPRSARSCADLLGRGVLPEQEHHRIAHVLEQHEGDERHGDHHDHGLEQATENKCKHRVGFLIESRC